jgi:hypothetical protein
MIMRGVAQQVFAALGPSQPERSSAEDQRLYVRLADTAQAYRW